MNSCIVLDIDHTLIYSIPKSETSTLREISSKRSFDYELNNFYGLFRHNMVEFLKWCFDNFDYVVIWSAGSYRYVHQMMDIMFKDVGNFPYFVLTRDDCYYFDDILTKPMNLVINKFSEQDIKIDLKNFFIIDDIEENFIFNKTYGIIIEKFYGDIDNELARIKFYISNLEGVDILDKDGNSFVF